VTRIAKSAAKAAVPGTGEPGMSARREVRAGIGVSTVGKMGTAREVSGRGAAEGMTATAKVSATAEVTATAKVTATAEVAAAARVAAAATATATVLRIAQRRADCYRDSEERHSQCPTQ
jgi:hypothetical protein